MGACCSCTVSRTACPDLITRLVIKVQPPSLPSTAVEGLTTSPPPPCPTPPPPLHTRTVHGHDVAVCTKTAVWPPSPPRPPTQPLAGALSVSHSPLLWLLCFASDTQRQLSSTSYKAALIVTYQGKGWGRVMWPLWGSSRLNRECTGCSRCHTASVPGWIMSQHVTALNIN